VTTNKLWLAFDIGTTGLKAAFVDSDGRIVRSAYRTYPTHMAENAVVEQDANDWWKAAVEACRELATDDLAKQIEGIALTGQMQDVILIDAEGIPVNRVILYSDTRAKSEAEGIVRRFGVERLRSLTGNDQDAGSLLAKLLWIKLHQPNLLATAKHLLLGAADFLAFKLNGVAATDTTTASTTGLMDIGERKALEREVLDEIGIGENLTLLPTMYSGGANIGKLTEKAAAELGLKTGIPIYLGPGDAGATTIGAGSGDTGRVYAYLGTSGWIAFTSPGRASPDQGAITLAHPKQTYYIQVAPLLTAGGNLEWVRNLFNAETYDELVEQSLDRPLSQMIYLPYLNGERSPFRDPLAKAAFIGMNGRTQKADLYRSVLEGVVYAYRHALNALLVFPASAITLTGGGTRSQKWCQLFADITNVPVDVAGDAENVGLRGAVLAARVAAGEITTYTPPNHFPIKVSLTPSQEHRQHFDQQYALFRELYPAIKPIFAKMS